MPNLEVQPGAINARCYHCTAEFLCGVKEAKMASTDRGLIMELLLDSTDFEIHLLAHQLEDQPVGEDRDDHTGLDI